MGGIERRWANVICVVLIAALGIGTAACSTGPSAAQQQKAAFGHVQDVIDDANALSRAQEEYAQDVQSPCPANLTPGTFPGYNCGQRPPLSTTQLRQAKDAIPMARSDLAAAERKCLLLVGELKNGKADGLRLRKSNCEVAVPPAQGDSPGT
jgi:hypothetical protein